MVTMSQLNQFDIVIRRKNSIAVAAVPQLGLYAKSENIQAALELLEKRQMELLQDLEIGAIDLDFITKHNRDSSRSTYMRTAAEFAIKTSIVVAILAAAVVLTGTFLAEQTDKMIQKARAVGLEYAAVGLEYAATVRNVRIGGREFWTRLEQGLEAAADPSNDISTEKKEKLIREIHAVADRWRPFATEVISAFSARPNESVPVSRPEQ
jgi:hypothetical protein